MRHLILVTDKERRSCLISVNNIDKVIIEKHNTLSIFDKNGCYYIINNTFITELVIDMIYKQGIKDSTGNYFGAISKI